MSATICRGCGGRDGAHEANCRVIAAEARARLQAECSHQGYGVTQTTGIPLGPRRCGRCNALPQRVAFRPERVFISASGTAGGAADWIIRRQRMIDALTRAAARFGIPHLARQALRMANDETAPRRDPDGINRAAGTIDHFITYNT